MGCPLRAARPLRSIDLFKDFSLSPPLLKAVEALGYSEPTPIQHIDTRGIHCRTFHIDPSGRLLVAAHIMGPKLRDGSTLSANLSVFRIAPDGKLDFVRTYPVDVGDKTMFWMGMAGT